MSNREGSLGATERNAWFSTADQAGTITGFFYRRIPHSVHWASTNRPVVGGDAIRNGLNNALGFGDSGPRAPQAWRAAFWPNLALLDVLSNGAPMTAPVYELALGAAAPTVRCLCLDYESGCTVTLHLDADRNPYNNNEVAVVAKHAIATATGGTDTPHEFAWDASVLKAGTTCYLCAKVANGARSRYLYAQAALPQVKSRAIKLQPLVRHCIQKVGIPSPSGSAVVSSLTRLPYYSLITMATKGIGAPTLVGVQNHSYAQFEIRKFLLIWMQDTTQQLSGSSRT